MTAKAKARKGQTPVVQENRLGQGGSPDPYALVPVDQVQAVSLGDRPAVAAEPPKEDRKR